MFIIHIYCLADSIVIRKVADAFKGRDDIKLFFNEPDILEMDSSKKDSADVIFIEEEDSFIYTVDIFEKIVNKYGDNTPVIVISKSKEIFNVVKWIRKGASDYLLYNEINENILLNSINGSLEYKKQNISIRKDDSLSEDGYQNGKVILPPSFDWNTLGDNQYYDMVLVAITINVEEDSIGRYSKRSIEKIYENIKSEISHMALKFGGRVWFSQSNFYVLSFYFGDAINLSVLFGLFFFNRFLLLCIDKLKLDELLKFKMSIHNGNCLYNKSNTEQITSDLINSLVHLETQYNKYGEMVITDSVYLKLSKRLIKHFEKIGIFEGKGIYRYIKSN